MTTQTQINLQAFCDEPGGRYTLDTPFVLRGWRYATDGKVMVRVSAEGEPDVEEGRRVPRKPEECLPAPPPNVAWHRFRKVRECLLCAGHGYIHVPCQRCGQDIKQLCDCKTDAVELGKACISKHYAAMISSLPKAEYAEPANATDPVRFRFDGGEGAICVLHNPKDR